jgi:hypothetical protein
MGKIEEGTVERSECPTCRGIIEQYSNGDRLETHNTLCITVKSLFIRIAKLENAQQELLTKLKLNSGDRVTISTHGDNQGTVLRLEHLGVVVQMDTEPGPRLCLAENVKHLTAI